MTNPEPISPTNILTFWFAPENRKLWFQSTPEFDQSLKTHYLSLYESAAEGGLESWKDTPDGALALCIILDQFPLNMFREQARSFSTEAAARDIAKLAIKNGFDQGMDNDHRLFFYLPYMHSENLEDQHNSVSLFANAGMETRWAEHHRDIVQRFGRFPHRNAALGRECTTEEEAWLRSEGAFHG